MSENVLLSLQTLAGPPQMFEFVGAEVPEQINFGGAQMLNLQKMVGGMRIVDAMGPDDAAITWSGYFLSQTAPSRAMFLDRLRRSGVKCALTWDVFKYTVVVSEFKAEFKKSFWIQYTITCQVVRDEVNAQPPAPNPAPDDAIADNSALMQQLAASVAMTATDPIATSSATAAAALSNVLSATQPLANGLVSLSAPSTGPQVGQVSTLSTGAASAIDAASAPLSALSDSVQNAIGSTEQSVASLPTLGYINPTLPMAGQVTALVAQCDAAAQLPALYELRAITTRMQANLALVADPAGNNQVVTGGGNLYQMAAQVYGDATRWSDIAEASDIDDPMMTGFYTVTVPQ